MTDTFSRKQVNSVVANTLTSEQRDVHQRTRTAPSASSLVSGSKLVRALKAISGTVLLSSIISTSLPVVNAMSRTGGSASAAASKNSAAKAANAGSAEMVAMATDARKRLSEISYLPVAGTDKAKPPSDERARYAILAFERVSGRKQIGKMDAAELEALKTAERPTPRETGYAHIEVDLTRQVLFVVDADSNVTLTLPISSGSGKLYTFQGKTDRAVTPRGRFVVYNKISGWRKAPLGMIYYPCYFDKGWAIHGSQSVPNYPASHGCVRIPIVTAKELSDITPVGTVVLVYDNDSVATK